MFSRHSEMERVGEEDNGALLNLDLNELASLTFVARLLGFPAFRTSAFVEVPRFVFLGSTSVACTDLGIVVVVVVEETAASSRSAPAKVGGLSLPGPRKIAITAITSIVTRAPGTGGCFLNGLRFEIQRTFKGLDALGDGMLGDVIFSSPMGDTNGTEETLPEHKFIGRWATATRLYPKHKTFNCVKNLTLGASSVIRTKLRRQEHLVPNDGEIQLLKHCIEICFDGGIGNIHDWAFVGESAEVVTGGEWERYEPGSSGDTTGVHPSFEGFVELAVGDNASHVGRSTDLGAVTLDQCNGRHKRSRVGCRKTISVR